MSGRRTAAALVAAIASAPSPEPSEVEALETPSETPVEALETPSETPAEALEAAPVAPVEAAAPATKPKQKRGPRLASMIKAAAVHRGVTLRIDPDLLLKIVQRFDKRIPDDAEISFEGSDVVFSY